MADEDTNDGMTSRASSVHVHRTVFHDGPRGIGALLPQVTRPAFKKNNPASALILADWEIIVGPKLAAITVPRKLDRGTLTIACAGPVAMALHYEGQELLKRINLHLGGQPVHSLRFTQAGMPRKPKDVIKPPPESRDDAEAAIADFPAGDLRSALVALGSVVIGRGKSSTRRSKKL